MEQALQACHFNDLGTTALWLTPVVRNVWRSGDDLGGWKCGYHGYWADVPKWNAKRTQPHLAPEETPGPCRCGQDPVRRNQ